MANRWLYWSRVATVTATLIFVDATALDTGIVTSNCYGQDEGTEGNSVEPSATPEKPSRKKRKKSRRSKKKPPSSDTVTQPNADNAATSESTSTSTAPKNPGVGIHAAQAGVDEPYAWHMALLSSFGKTDRSQGDTKSGHATYHLEFKALYIFGGRFELGPEIEFFESSAKQNGETNSTNSWLASLVMMLNFGHIDTDVFVPFLDIKAGSGQDQDKFGETKTTTATTQFGIGLGMHYFVDSNVAFTARSGYNSGTAKSKVTVGGTSTNGDPVKSSTIDYLDLGFSLFL